MKQVYLTMGAVIRDQEHYVKEWLTFHHLAGVERFTIVLHKCVDSTEDKIKELPFQDKIHVHKIVSGEQIVQLATYKWLVEKYGEFTQWMMFIDSDEFYFGTKEDDLKVILTDYESHGGVLANWLEFGSNGHVLRPKNLSIDAFTLRARDNHGAHFSFKTIVQPRYFKRILSPHLAITDPVTVTEDFYPVKDRWIWIGDRKPSHKVVRCNHYHVRSMEDWVQRYKRGQCNDACMGESSVLYPSNIFCERDHRNIEDRTICRFSSRLRAALK